MMLSMPGSWDWTGLQNAAKLDSVRMYDTYGIRNSLSRLVPHHGDQIHLLVGSVDTDLTYG